MSWNRQHLHPCHTDNIMRHEWISLLKMHSALRRKTMNHERMRCQSDQRTFSDLARENYSKTLCLVEIQKCENIGQNTRSTRCNSKLFVRVYLSQAQHQYITNEQETILSTIKWTQTRTYAWSIETEAWPDHRTAALVELHGSWQVTIERGDVRVGMKGMETLENGTFFMFYFSPECGIIGKFISYLT